MDKPYYINTDAAEYLNRKILEFPRGIFENYTNSLKCIELTKEEVIVLKLKIELILTEYDRFFWVFIPNMSDYIHLRDLP